MYTGGIKSIRELSKTVCAQSCTYNSIALGQTLPYGAACTAVALPLFSCIRKTTCCIKSSDGTVTNGESCFPLCNGRSRILQRVYGYILCTCHEWYTKRIYS